MKHWFADGPFRTILRNASFLVSGKLGGALLSLVALACAGHALTPTLFGTLAIVQVYASGVSAIIKFQTWQFIVRYGAPALQNGDLDRFRDVTNFSFGLDLTSGLIGLVGGMILLPFLANWVGIDEKDLHLALLYCTLIPILTAATPVGILRTLDRFDLIAGQEMVTPFICAVGSIFCYFAGLGFAGFVVTWYIAELIGGSILWFFSARELRRREIEGALIPKLWSASRRIKGSWDFVWTTNIGHSIWSAWGPLSNVLVGGMLGPSAAGLFRIASTFFEAAGKPASFLDKSFYPEIMRLDPASKRPWQLGIRSGLLAGGIGIVMFLLIAVGGEPLITLVFGKRYDGAFDLLQIMSVSLIVTTITFPLGSLLYMAHRQRAAMVAEGLAVLMYGLLLVAFVHWFGLIGAGYAYVAGMLLKGLFMLLPTLGAYRKRHLLSHDEPKEIQ